MNSLMDAEGSGQQRDVIMAGTGGRGVLVAARTLALAATSCYPHVSWLPSYAVSQRGGQCECTVVFDTEEVASPLVLRSGAAVIFDSVQLKPYEGRVHPGGVLVVESTDLENKVNIQGVGVYMVPALKLAAELGEVTSLNFILLGAYLGATGALPVEAVEAEVRKRYAARKDVVTGNLRALSKGLEFIQGQLKSGG
ncbi:MAG: 2-oxoacid:acceptor oxidoreductase family protein [Chloroflexota bacterium]